MKVAFYMDFANMKTGGVYIYAKGVLNGLVQSERIEKIYLLHREDIQDVIADFTRDPKIEHVVFSQRSTGFKLRQAASYFLLNTASLYAQDFQKYFPKRNVSKRLKQLAYRLNPLRSRVNRLDADVLHIPLNIPPIFGINKALVITVHDVQEIHFPGYFDANERMRRAVNYKVGMDEADGVVVWFDHVKEDLQRYFQLDASRIRSCLPPVANDWFEHVKASTPDVLQDRYHLNKPYVFYPAATWEHKNHLVLLQALMKVRQNHPDVQLVCTGHQSEYMQHIRSWMEANQTDWVHFLGIVEESDLLGLYQHAEMVVFPSLYEGGGIPAFEAMRMSIPILCSNIYPFRQSIGSERFLFDPNQPDDVADKVNRMLEEADYRNENIENSRSQTKKFNEMDAASSFIQAYTEAIAYKQSNVEV